MTTTTAPSVPTNRHVWRPVSEVASRLLQPGDTLLTVWAHPDDESYLGAGLMAGAARMGVRVVSVSATLGEHGTDDPSSLPPARLAALRGEELRRALAALGVRWTAELGYEDGTCERVHDRSGAERLARVMEAVRPDAVLSFDTDGVTGHPDHRAVARWTREAVAMGGDAAPLVTVVPDSVWPADLVARMHSVSMFYPGYPRPFPPGPFVPVRVSGEVLDRKLSALREHGSQVGPLLAALGAHGYRRMAGLEAYRPANSPASQRLSDLAVWPKQLSDLDTVGTAA